MTTVKKVLLVILFFSSTQIVANEDALIYGKIDYYKLGKGEIVIDDAKVKLATNLIVYDEDKKSVSRAALTQGHDILFKLFKKDDRSPLNVVEIHLISSGT